MMSILVRIAVALTGAWLLVSALDAASPPTSSIRRDEYGVPHILARTEGEAAFLHGYAAGEDHLALMARLYLRAAGRQSEFFGPDFIEQDFFVQQLEIRERAATALPSLAPAIRSMLERFAEGYNTALRKAGADAPPYAREIAAADVLAHCYTVLLIDFGIVTRGDRIPGIDRGPATDRGPSAGDAPASAMWMLGPAKTTSGHAMLLANPHLRWEDPFTLHEVHLRVPGAIDIYGVTFVGSPIVSIGFNPALGWSHTVNQVDITDVYRLALDEERTHYRFDDEWRPLRARRLTVRVKRDDGMRDESRMAWWSHHGPVIRIDGRTAYAVRTSAADSWRFVEQWNAMAKAKNFKAFRAALDIQGLPMFNVGYADRDGHIAFLAGGRVPKRPGGFTWSGVVSGDTSASDWGGLHPNRDLPQLTDPASGYLQNSNEPPWHVNRQEPIRAEGYPAYMTAGSLSARAQASLALIQSRPRFSLEQVIEAKSDATSYAAAKLKPRLLAALREANDDTLTDAIALLASWDNSMKADRRGAVLFELWWQQYTKAASAAGLAEGRIDDPARAAQALRDAIRLLSERRVPLQVAWGDVHRFRRGAIDLPMSGCAFILGCFRAMTFRAGDDGRQTAYFGDAFVMAVEFGKTPRAFGVLAYSQSSDPRSPHFADQSALFAADRLRPIWFSEAEIRAHTASVFTPDLPLSTR